MSKKILNDQGVLMMISSKNGKYMDERIKNVLGH
jgi:hypothetical protein